MATETWEIETGPVSGDVEDGFVDVKYSIRYPRGTFEVVQRVRCSPAGYAEAYKRIERIVTDRVSRGENKHGGMPVLPNATKRSPVVVLPELHL